MNSTASFYFNVIIITKFIPFGFLQRVTPRDIHFFWFPQFGGVSVPVGFRECHLVIKCSECGHNSLIGGAHFDLSFGSCFFFTDCWDCFSPFHFSQMGGGESKTRSAYKCHTSCAHPVRHRNMFKSLNWNWLAATDLKSVLEVIPHRLLPTLCMSPFKCPLMYIFTQKKTCRSSFH